MNPGIFLIQNNEELVEMNEQHYDSEKLLQSWPAKYPALLVGGQIDATEPRRWLLIEQECGVPSEEGGSERWAIDHLWGVEIAGVAKRLIDWSKQNVSHINWGKGANDGCFSPVLDYGSSYSLIPFRVYTYGNAEILFNRMRERQNKPFDSEHKRIELLNRLNEVPGINLPQAGINRRPSISLTVLADDRAFLKFQQAIEWVIDEVKTAAKK